MRLVGQLGLATACALVMAGIAHVGVVMAIPWFSEADAVSRLATGGKTDRSRLIPAGGERAWPPFPDPAVVLASCPYNLDGGPVRVSARTGNLFESVSFHARGGALFYALTDRAAVRGTLDLVVMTRAQHDAAVEEDGDEPSPDVRVVAPGQDGVIIIRVLAGLRSQREEAERLARAVMCTVEGVLGGDRLAPEIAMPTLR